MVLCIVLFFKENHVSTNPTDIKHSIILFGNHYPYLVYGLILFLSIVEGPVLAITLGILLKVGYFYFVPVYLVLIAGDLIGDTLLYTLGYRYGRNIITKVGNLFGFNTKHVEKIERLFNQYHEKILFFSKLTNGFGFSAVILFTAGITRIPFTRFITINTIGQFAWSGMLLAVGYFFGSLYEAIPSTTGKIILASISIVFCLIAIRYINHKKKQWNN